MDRRLKRVANITVSNVDKKSVEGEPEVRLCNYTDVYYNDRITSDMEFMLATAKDEQVQQFSLAPGDVVITKDSETPDDIAVPAFVADCIPMLVCGYHLAFIRPKEDVDGRYLFWALAGQQSRSQLAAAATGVTRFGLRYDSIGDLLIRIPDLEEQRAIADYLDTETARIDALIEKKTRMESVAVEHFRAVVEATVLEGNPRLGPLMHITDQYRPIMYGIALPGPNVEVGVPIVKGGDVAARRLDPARLNRTTIEIEAPYARARLARGDLVFAIRGGIGDVESVPEALVGANITQDVARVAPAPDVDSNWLRLVLQTSFVQRQVGARTTGATVKGLNIWDLKRITVPMSNHERQKEDLARLRPAEEKAERLSAALRRQLSLLQEHRQALVTAAVTGEFEVPGAAA